MPKNDGTVTFSVWLDAEDAERELTKVKKKILDLQADLNRKNEAKSALVEDAIRAGEAYEQARNQLKALYAERDRLKGYSRNDPEYYPAQRRLPVLNQEIKQQEAVVKGLEAASARADAALEKQDAAIQKTNADLEHQIQKYGMVQKASMEAGESGRSAAQKSSTAMDKLAQRIDKFTSRLVSLAKRVLIFSMVTRALRAFRQYIGNALLTSDEFTAALAKLKGAAQTAFQPLLTAGIPIITALINVLTNAMSVLASFTSMLFGSTVEQSAQSAEAMNAEAKAIKDVGGAAGKAAKQLAKFDEINQLGSSGGGGGGGASSGVAANYDFAAMDGLTDKMRETEIVIEGMALLLGALLTFSGANIPLGLGLIAVGAAGLAKEWPENWEYIKSKLKGPFGWIAALVSGALLTVGVILAFAGPATLGIGLGLIAAGAAGLAATVAVNWGAIKTKIKENIRFIELAAGTALLGLGVILTFAGPATMALGIGLMAAGAAAIATAAGLDWNALWQLIKQNVDKILMIAGGALLAVGLILTLSGGAAPLGIGLMIAGAASLAVAAALNWETIGNWISENLNAIRLVAGASLLALGLILTLSGAALPLGIALMIAGAATLVGVAVTNWDSVKKWVSENLKLIELVAGTSLLALGLILALSGAALPLGIGLMIAGGATLAVAAGLDWNLIKTKLQDAWSGIASWWKRDIAPIFTKEWWSAKFDAIGQGMRSALNAVIGFVENCVNWIVSKLNLLSIDIPPVFGAEGVHLGFNLPYVSIPRLATGAVIPPNREFLAVLGDQTSGTNIEAPLETIVAAFRQAMRESGGGSRTVILEVDGQQFGRVVLDAYNTESRRVGVQLGGAT